MCNYYVDHELERKNEGGKKKRHLVFAGLDGRRTGMGSGFVMKKPSLTLMKRHLIYLELTQLLLLSRQRVIP